LSLPSYAFAGEGVQLARLPRFISKPFHFKLEPGRLWVVEAPNGGGKTTFLKTVMGVLHPLAGRFWAESKPLSLDSLRHRRQIAFAGHRSTLRLQESVQQQLQEGLNLYQASPCAAAVAEAVGCFGLESLLQVPCAMLSQGQRQRLILCRVHLSRRPCWLLDEPHHHLDSQGIAAFQQSLRAHLQQGGSAILTSPHPGVFGEGADLLTLESETFGCV
jgi:heme exporter protein A